MQTYRQEKMTRNLNWGHVCNINICNHGLSMSKHIISRLWAAGIFIGVLLMQRTSHGGESKAGETGTSLSFVAADRDGNWYREAATELKGLRREVFDPGFVNWLELTQSRLEPEKRDDGGKVSAIELNRVFSAGDTESLELEVRDRSGQRMVGHEPTVAAYISIRRFGFSKMFARECVAMPLPRREESSAKDTPMDLISGQFHIPKARISNTSGVARVLGLDFTHGGDEYAVTDDRISILVLMLPDSKPFPILCDSLKWGHVCTINICFCNQQGAILEVHAALLDQERACRSVVRSRL